MAKASKEKQEHPTSVKLSTELKQGLEDWCWLHRTSLAELLRKLAEDHLKANPLTKAQKEFIEKHRGKD